MKVYKRMLTSLLIVAIFLGLLPPFAPAVPAEAASPWVKESSKLSIGNERFPLDAWVIKEDNTYKMWYTHVTTNLTDTEILNTLKALNLDNIISAIATTSISKLFDSKVDLAGNVSAIRYLLNNVTTTIGYATSTDGKTWTVQKSEALAGSSSPLWLRDPVGAPTVISDNGTYRMWYTRLSTNLTESKLQSILTDLGNPTTRKQAILDFLNSTFSVIGYATSSNGSAWEVQNPQSLAGGSSGIWTRDSVGAPSVIKDGATYKMWYTRLRTDLTEADLDTVLTNVASFNADNLLGILDGTNAVIGYATSDNGTDWVVQNPQVFYGGSGLWQSVADPTVIKNGTLYEMWYTNVKRDLTPSGFKSLISEFRKLPITTIWNSFKAQGFAQAVAELASVDLTAIKTLLGNSSTVIGYATSNDGTNWSVQDAQNLVGTTGALWSSVSSPSVVKVGGRYDMWFTKGFDDITWQKLLERLLGLDLSIGYASVAKVLQSINVAPTSASIAVGRTQQFTATGGYSDNSTANLTSTTGIVWNSTNTTVASINATGLATGLAIGSTNITATFGDVTSNVAILTVTEKELDLITLSPLNPIRPKGVPVQFSALGTYSDNSTANITTAVSWSSSNTTVATINATGVASTKAVGSTTITASLGIRSASTTLMVNPPAFVAMIIAPANPTVALGDSVNFTATDYLTDNSTIDRTIQATWTSSNTTVATIGANTGRATTLATGNTTITAAYVTHTATTLLTVGAKVLRKIEVDPSTASIAAGRTQQFTATGRYSDNSTISLTGAPGVVWSSTNTTVASIGATTGLARGLSAGVTTITASLGPLSGTASLTVTPPVLDLITLSPLGPSVPIGIPVQFTAMGTYSDNSTANITALAIWSSSNTTVATINAAGLASTLAAGSTTITASYDSQTANTTLTVTTSQLVSLAVSPVNPDLPLGLTLQFSANATYTDNSTFNVTSLAIWTSSNVSVATIAAGGLASTLAAGSTTITASYDSRTASTTLTVIAPAFTHMVVTPANQVIAAGSTLQFTAIEYYTDNSSVNVTAVAVWTSSNTTVATVNVTLGLATGVAAGTTTITATNIDRSASTTLTVVPPLQSLTVTPISASIHVGRTQQFLAMGRYFDGSIKNLTSAVGILWTSSNPAKATIGSGTGLATGVATGSAIITATYAGMTSNEAVLTVTAPELDAVHVLPSSKSIPLGTTFQFSAVGVYSDGSTLNITTLASWSSNSTAVATISSSGLATGRGIGSANITASYGTKSGSAVLTVTEAEFVAMVVTPANPTVAAGDNITFAATEYLTDGSSIDRTAAATWESSNTTVAAFVAGSKASALAVGTTTVTASYGGRSGTTVLTVTTARLTGVTISAPTTNVTAGKYLQLTLTGRYSDGSTRDLTSDPATIWASLSPSVATVNATGSVKGLVPLTAIIRATNSGERDEITVTVTEATLEAVAVTPMHVMLPQNVSAQFTATGYFSDGSTRDMTASVAWTSSNTTVISISTKGMATTLSPGAATVNATSGAFTGSSFVVVTSATLVAITISPSSATVPAGRTYQFYATGNFSDGSSAFITDVATWASANAAVASVAPGGLAKGKVAGSTTISASFATKTGSAALTVSPAVLDTIRVTPANPSIAKGRTLQMIATATLSDKSVVDYTSQVTWSSSNSTIVSVTAGGLAKGEVVGAATVFATKDSVSDNTTVTVTAAELDAITVAPEKASVAAGRKWQFTATGHFSDNSTANLTSAAGVVWQSSSPAVATVDDAGLATSYVPGAATITATRSGRTGAGTLTVTERVIDSISISPVNRTISAGLKQQFRAFVVYSNGAKTDVTSSATWESTNTTIASITAGGLATGSASGNTTIRATYESVPGSTTLYVTTATLRSLTVTPSTPDIPAGRAQQFTAEGTFTDSSKVGMTDSVNWTSSDMSVAKVNALGLAISFTPGTVNITATWGTVVSLAARLRVQAAELDSVTVSPVNPTITFVSGNPSTLQFRATRVDSDGSTSDATAIVTWSSFNTGVATITATGLATTVGAGSTNITAALSGATGTTTLTVLPDTVPPRVTLTSPVEGMTLGSKALAVSGRVDDRTAPTTVIVNGVSSTLTLDPNGNFNKSVLLNTGSNTVSVRAVDGNGNTGTSGTVVVVVDLRKPSVTITSPGDETLTNNPSLTVTGNVTNATDAILILNGVSQNVPVTGGGFAANVTLADGINILVVQAYAATNPGDADYLGTSGVRRVVLDRTAPAVAINTPVSGAFVNMALATVSGTVDDPAVKNAQLILNGVPQTVAVVGGSFSQDVTLSPGANSIQVVATDRAGNTSTAPVTVTLDTTKPEVMVAAPTNNLLTKSASLLVTGAVSDPAIPTADIRVNGVSHPASVVPGDGTFSRMVTLNEGANTIEAWATDAGGKTGTSGNISVTVDARAPRIVVGLTDPTESVIITVSSNEALSGVPTVRVDGTLVTLTPVDVNRWAGVYGSSSSPIAAGDYTVTVAAADKAGNAAVETASFAKKKVSVDGVKPSTVTAPKTKLDIETKGAVTDADISVTHSPSNPSGNVGNPKGVPHAARVFLEIIASPELRDNLKQIYVEIAYDPTGLAPGVEPRLKLYLWDVASGEWKVVPNSGVNMVKRVIFGTIEELSKYGGFGTAPPPPPPAVVIGVPALPPGAVPIPVDFTGTFRQPFALLSSDAKLAITFTAGTKVLDKDGKATVTWVRAVTQTQPAAMPAAVSAVSVVYSLGPDGATFSPPIPVTITYDAAKIPAGVDANSLYIATWNAATSTWERLTTTVNAAARTATASVSHFSDFAVLASARPATFTVSDLKVGPPQVNIGQDVTITVLVTNTGDLAGTFSVNLVVQGEVLQTKQVTLAGGASERVTFTVRKDVDGTFTVSIEKQSGSFTVRPPVIAPRPAAFTPKDLSVSPAEVDINQNVAIAVTVTNTGELSGSYKVTLKVNGVAVDTKDVTVAGGASEKVTFTVARDAAGTYAVDVNGLSGRFTVRAAPPPPPPPPPPPVAKPKVNWALIGAIIVVAVVIVVLVVILLVRRRPRGA